MTYIEYNFIYIMLPDAVFMVEINFPTIAKNKLESRYAKLSRGEEPPLPSPANKVKAGPPPPPP